MWLSQPQNMLSVSVLRGGCIWGFLAAEIQGNLQRVGVGLGVQKGFGSGAGWESGEGFGSGSGREGFGMGVRGGDINGGRRRVRSQEAWGVGSGRGRGRDEGWAGRSRGACTLHGDTRFGPQQLV